MYGKWLVLAAVAAVIFAASVALSMSVGAGVAYAADRRDIDASTFATIDGENYTVARLYGSYELRPNLTLKVRLENLLNEKYESVNGYPAPGFGAFGGIEWRW